MFNLGEKVRMKTYDEKLEIFAHIIEIRFIKKRIAYVVQFRSGKVRTYFENEILKIQ